MSSLLIIDDYFNISDRMGQSTETRSKSSEPATTRRSVKKTNYKTKISKQPSSSHNCKSKPAPCIRKGMKLNKWDESSMKSALAEYREKKVNDGVAHLRAIARAWGVPKTTMERRLKFEDMGHAHASGRPPVISAASEAELAALLIDMARRGFPLSEKQVRNLATQFAKKNNLNVFSKNKDNHAGYYWWKGFLKRHPELCVKRAEGLSAARSGAMNKPNIEKWFGEYSQLLDRLKINDLPSHIWNLDESGLQDVLKPRELLERKELHCTR